MKRKDIVDLIFVLFCWTIILIGIIYSTSIFAEESNYQKYVRFINAHPTYVLTLGYYDGEDFAQGMAKMSLGVIGSGTPAAAGGNCMTGTYTFAWTGDYPSDTDAACDSVGTAVQGTLVNGVISTDYGESGTNGLQIDAASEYIVYTTSADAHFDPSIAQTVWLRIYVSANPVQNTGIFYACGATDCTGVDYINIIILTTGEVLGSYRNDTISVQNYSASSVSLAAWIDVAYTWDPTNQDHDITHNGTTWSEDVNEITTTSTWDAVRINTGNRSTSSPSANYILIDKMAVVNGYRASKPSGW